jgi:serine/threonine protein kinase
MSEKSAKAEGKNLEYEALAMKRFVDKDHDHLIRLLATYTHGGYFHMILPCADGNLKNFWQAHVNPLFPARDSQMALSVAKQCFGLARALESIHTSPVDASNHQKLDTVFRVKEHGRHGDLKPENILWFQLTEDNEARSPLGILKISDFGFADFHRTHSVNVIGRNAIGGITQTYRAPEYEVSNMISPAYDIWSFGCVLLQFAVWYVYGWEGIEKFSKRRAAEATNPIYQEDNFFNFDESSRKATEKLAVLQVSDKHMSLDESLLIGA